MSTHDFVDSPFLVGFDGDFSIAGSPCAPDAPVAKKKELKHQLRDCIGEFDDLQRRLYADDRHAVLLVFQAMDAAGKDSTIRSVLSGVNPAGCQVFSFKQPSKQELDHDFLWRTAARMPERGRIGVFNRSYYEEVLVVRVHPEYLGAQRLPDAPPQPPPESFWQARYQSIAEHERHLSRNGTVIIKFWLNVSFEEQRRRFLSRIDEPRKNWKFSSSDVAERGHWPKYMQAYEQMLNATSQPWAPWYAIPADHKPFMRLTVARIIVHRMNQLGLDYPEPDPAELARLQQMRAKLEGDQ